MQEVKGVAKVRVRAYRVSGNFLRHMLKQVFFRFQAMCIACCRPTCCIALSPDIAFHAYFCVYWFGNFLSNLCKITLTQGVAICLVT